MLKADLKDINNDVKNLVKDAQQLLQAAVALTDAQARGIQNRGMHLLDTALTRAQDIQTSTVVAGQEMATLADSYVKKNPWRVIATAAGVGFLAGVILSRK